MSVCVCVCKRLYSITQIEDHRDKKHAMGYNLFVNSQRSFICLYHSVQDTITTCYVTLAMR